MHLELLALDCCLSSVSTIFTLSETSVYVTAYLSYQQDGIELKSDPNTLPACDETKTDCIKEPETNGNGKSKKQKAVWYVQMLNDAISFTR